MQARFRSRLMRSRGRITTASASVWGVGTQIPPLRPKLTKYFKWFTRLLAFAYSGKNGTERHPKCIHRRERSGGGPRSFVHGPFRAQQERFETYGALAQKPSWRERRNVTVHRGPEMAAQT